METKNKIVGSDAPREPFSVGREFVAWAETYWRLKEVYNNSVKNPAEKNAENAPYVIVKNMFAEHIDQLIANRLQIFIK